MNSGGAKRHLGVSGARFGSQVCFPTSSNLFRSGFPIDSPPHAPFLFVFLRLRLCPYSSPRRPRMRAHARFHDDLFWCCRPSLFPRVKLYEQEERSSERSPKHFGLVASPLIHTTPVHLPPRSSDFLSLHPRTNRSTSDQRGVWWVVRGTPAIDCFINNLRAVRLVLNTLGGLPSSPWLFRPFGGCMMLPFSSCLGILIGDCVFRLASGFVFKLIGGCLFACLFGGWATTPSRLNAVWFFLSLVRLVRYPFPLLPPPFEDFPSPRTFGLSALAYCVWPRPSTNRFKNDRRINEILRQRLPPLFSETLPP